MGKISENGLFLLLFLSSLLAGIPQTAQGRDFRQAPRAMTALRQGQAAQHSGNLQKAIALYCVAASTGNPEGYFRIGRLLATGPASVRSAKMANSYLAMAMRLGNQQASRYYNPRVGNAPMGDQCGVGMRGGQGSYFALPSTPFNVEAYLARQSPGKQKLATMLRHAAKRHQVDVRLVLAIAIAESNLESRAVSAKNAQGVMQLIPETQQRFGVTQPFDPAQNIKGGVSYLKWLDRRFDGDWVLISAAYNAGEKAVERYGGIPPYDETREYVKRVLYFAGHKQP
ncbi:MULTISPECIES: lytic transglycosylase domain-containing protein [Aeromonas]|uniref:Lytic transglycosylase domain-containing protein n=1 Tax=Aeromonas jandaei TaxID=650 RepID=A0ABD7EL05_AERJA|nr:MULTISPECIES: lytic transglycosylase domain-containing protein [Aeromonas]KIQ82847.1 lytic transglycosylase [Aeromonas sp. L_1B5_3]MBL0545011.1 lytic transglycosylase domain-containing protein [Aeromonas jandaei]MBL0626237.1 lytic transglycosylase domain-containing protein [Aeromonas jandaei]MBW3760939.1 lytic transglycosylase domain-containing protein [Aeromonas jandaei]MBW3804337.1 lytic transglycosylase domain-containing protein [Aeromonas jandaei]